jgi:hypothetical protein
MFPAEGNLLEGELVYEDEASNLRGGVVIAGSHPLLGGTMKNNVVQGLGNGIAESAAAPDRVSMLLAPWPNFGRRLTSRERWISGTMF